jgi:uncharacterized protein YbjT (DUF2867 family)
VANDSALTRAVVTRLREQDDEVRAIHAGPVTASKLEALGVHIARGPYLDADLIERAGQNCRTVVVIEPEADVLDEVVTGMVAARIPRLVAAARSLPSATVERATEAGLEFVALKTAPRGLLRRSTTDEDLAEAIDAADDIAGNPRLQLDLAQEDAWNELGLAPR